MNDRLLRTALIVMLALTLIVAWQASVGHLYKPTVRTPVPAPRVVEASTPTPAELEVRIYGLR